MHHVDAQSQGRYLPADAVKESISFGLAENNFYSAKNLVASKFGFSFDVYKDGKLLEKIELKCPGKHNVMNALAAISVCDYLEVPVSGIKSAIEEFVGAGRRFEFYGEFAGFTLADDYAHHPTEIEATLNAAKNLNFKRVIAVFQPFTFSRTALLKDDFIKALSVADKVILTPIMGSREVNTFGITSQDIADGLSDCICVDDFESAVSEIICEASDGDIVITMGGGDIYKVAQKVKENLSN